MEIINNETMKAILKEFGYVFGRSGVNVCIIDGNIYADPTDSQWGSKTSIAMRISQHLQRHSAENTCRVSLSIIGATTMRRMEKIGLAGLVFTDPDVDDLFLVKVEAEEFPVSDLPYSLRGLQVRADLQRHNTAVYPGMVLEIPGKYRIECGTHSCESCGKNGCFYTDFDGVITYADGEAVRFHVTCSGNIQL